MGGAGLPGAGDAANRRTCADESVARSFTRAMKASCSPLGFLTDPPLVALGLAVTTVLALALGTGAGAARYTGPLVGLAALPLVVCLAAVLALSGARARVVAWLAGLPFPVENANGLLSGVALVLRIRFREAPPGREELNRLLERVHEDCFVTEIDEAERSVDVRIGVPDSKLNPAGANRRRYLRVVALVERVLVPLADASPIEEVWIC
ncbi:MAG: hypothetical protein HY744_00260 [Deltaproteobacteria bacterium]|nr:hypothetical protein [Deltaproteobacteria bacterium]